MFNNFVTWMVKLLLLSLKIFETPLYCILYSIILMSIGAVGILGSIIGFLNTTETSDTVAATVSISAQMNGVLLFITVLVNRENILELMGELEKKYTGGEKVPNRSEIFVRIKLIWFFTVGVLTGIWFTVPPLITTTYEKSFDEKRSLLIPYWYSCGNKDSNGRLCWDVPASSRLTVHALNMYQSTSITIYVFAYLLSFSLYGLAVGELEIHMEIICRKLDRFNALANGAGLNGNRVEARLYQQFLQIVKHKKFLHRSVAKTTNTWKLYLSSFYGATFVDMTLFIFAMIGLGPNQKLLAFRVLGLALSRSLMALISAHYAQNISHLSEEFLRVMSEIKWYNRKAKFCRAYLQVLTLHQRSNPIKIASIIELNLNFFARLVRNIYSVSNILYLRYGR